jgi:hypothetical protein
MKTEQFEVKRHDLSESRMVSGEAPALDDGEVLTKIDRFALTANNITYGVVGAKLGYWNFFPVESDWGVIPVWGFADVIDSLHPDIGKGERLYGYFPMGTHLRLRPGKIKDTRLTDMTEHRAELPAVYNSYARTSREAAFDTSMEDERMLLAPLYATSFCLYDFLRDNEYFAASQIIIPSASSKTAIGLAYALQADSSPLARVALTSSGNRAKVESLGLYDSTVTYDELDSIDSAQATVIVDMSGNGKVLSDLHALLGDNMKYTSNVGVTHYDANEMGPNFIRERSEMFFAPAHIQKRSKEWGPGEFEKKALRFWYEAALKSRDWLTIEHYDGMAALSDVYDRLLAGRIPPDQGIIVSL